MKRSKERTMRKKQTTVHLSIVTDITLVRYLIVAQSKQCS